MVQDQCYSHQHRDLCDRYNIQNTVYIFRVSLDYQQTVVYISRIVHPIKEIYFKIIFLLIADIEILMEKGLNKTNDL